MKTFIKKNYKVAIAFVLGAIIFCGVSVYATTVASSLITYTKPNGTNTYVDQALDELYTMAESKNSDTSTVLPLVSGSVQYLDVSAGDYILLPYVVKLDGVQYSASSTSIPNFEILEKCNNYYCKGVLLRCANNWHFDSLPLQCETKKHCKDEDK